MIPVWVQVFVMLVNAIVQLVKLIIELRKTDPEAAKQCSIALEQARKTGDTAKIQELIAKLGKDSTC